MRIVFTLAAVLALCVGSGAAPPASGSPGAVVSVDTVKVTPTLDTLIIRTNVKLTARIVDSVGRKKNATVTWVARDTSAVRVSTPHKDSTGFYSTRVWAKADTGRSYVVATAGTKKDSALMIVQDTTCDPDILKALHLEPDSATAHRTDTLGLTLAPRNQCNGLMDAQNPTWSTSNGALATVTRVDSLVARVVALDSNGTVYIKAVMGTVRDSVKVKLKHAP